jgi:hypothetical protein
MPTAVKSNPQSKFAHYKKYSRESVSRRAVGPRWHAAGFDISGGRRGQWPALFLQWPRALRIFFHIFIW